jgi:hypothetical protein
MLTAAAAASAPQVLCSPAFTSLTELHLGRRLPLSAAQVLCSPAFTSLTAQLNAFPYFPILSHTPILPCSHGHEEEEGI